MAVEMIRDFTGRGETRTQAVRGGLGMNTPATEGPGQPSFGELLKDFGGDVNNLQFKASNSIDMLVTGQSTDVHQVMVAVEEAGIALDLMLEIRNRVLEGYQELIRMQV
ncbi:MAG: flagellar hook-basal body complex protein FliE [Candidatus Latescibacteria bacterium]|nr:flagellar hook-basal body complex protein FliE [Candidatus Latescibacterota bacterium]